MFVLNIIRKETLVEEHWAGGSTTEIMIFPQDSSYHQRNFQWRLSFATITQQLSVFTKLSGFYRKTLVLEGQLKLMHEGHHSVSLNTLEQDHYSGDWQTTSEGLVTNLNIIMDAAHQCHFKVTTIDSAIASYVINKQGDEQFLLLALAPMKMKGTDGEIIELKKGDSVSTDYSMELNLIAVEKIMHFIEVKIKRN